MSEAGVGIPEQVVRRPLWRNLNFTLMWTSTAASGFGDRILMLTAWVLLGGLAVGTDSTSLKAGISFAFFAPYILLSLPAGWLADRLPRKWIMLACDQTRGLAILLGLYWLVGATGSAHVADRFHSQVIIVVVIAGACAATFNPARNAVVPEIIPRAQLQPANAVILGINVVASMCGILLFNAITDADSIESVKTGLWLCAGFYLISGWFFAFLRPIPHQRVAQGTASRSLWPGVVYALRHKRLLVLMGFNILLWAAGAMVFSAVPGLARTHFGLTGDEQLSFEAIVSAAVGLGMLVGAIVIGTLGRRRESTMTLMVATVLLGAVLVSLSLVPVYGLSVMLGFLVGVFGNIAIVTTITTIQCLTPNYIRGRVMGLTALTNTMVSVVTYFVIWRVPEADTIIVIALGVMGTVMVLVGLAGLWTHMSRGPMEADRVANGFWHFVRWYTLIYHRCRWVGRYRVPSEGPVIFAANHTTGLDPLVMQAGCLRRVRWLMLTSYLFWFLGPLWRSIKPIAMDYGENNTGRIKRVVTVLKEDRDVVGIFPEGSLQRTERVLAPLKPGIVMIQRRSGAPIQPIWIDGTPRKHAMLWHFFWPGRVTVVYGEVWRPEEGLSTEAFLEELRCRMEALEAEVAGAKLLPCNG
ncbi:MFS transporter [Mucisphaera sp.]|uniref:MFS transporter n=1 Tax=Mucisphaera sp. TaxID=2913024 RepID=UPI003D0EBA15